MIPLDLVIWIKTDRSRWPQSQQFLIKDLGMKLTPKMKNKTTFILNTFLVFSIKVVLFFSFCHSMMVKLGSEFLYQEHFYKINI